MSLPVTPEDWAAHELMLKYVELMPGFQVLAIEGDEPYRLFVRPNCTQVEGEFALGELLCDFIRDRITRVDFVDSFWSLLHITLSPLYWHYADGQRTSPKING
jgi:hypothetical protein